MMSRKVDECDPAVQPSTARALGSAPACTQGRATPRVPLVSSSCAPSRYREGIAATGSRGKGVKPQLAVLPRWLSYRSHDSLHSCHKCHIYHSYRRYHRCADGAS